jgi:hypothetical protein
MEAIFTIITIIAGLAVVGPCLARVVVAYQQGMNEIETMEVMARHLHDEGRRAMERAAVVENELTGLMRERDEFQARIKPLEDSIAPDKLASRDRVYMAADRYSAWDEEFYLTITNKTIETSSFHALAVESWQRGRKHLFWAATEADVRVSAEARFPAALGYVIASIEIPQKRLLVPDSGQQSDDTGPIAMNS